MKRTHGTMMMALLLAAGCLSMASGAQTAHDEKSQDPSAPLQVSASDSEIAKASAAAARRPDSDAAWVILGDAFMQKARETADSAYYSRAEHAYRKALELNPKCIDAMAGMAWVSGGRHEFEASIDWSKKVLALDPTNGVAEAQIGADLARLEGCTPAMPHFEAAIRLNPTIIGPFLNLGMCAALQGDNALALRSFEAAVRLRPEDLVPLEGLALALSKFPERLPEAIQQFKVAIGFHPRDAKLRGDFGLLLASIGQSEEAIEQLQAVLELEPFPDPQITATLNRLRAERNRPADRH